MANARDELETFVSDYVDYLKASFEELWSKVQIEADKLEAYSAIGALLSRQVTLSIQMAQSPGTWNAHSAPLFLRAMVDLQITLSWMLQDLEERAKKYILHGLGEAKLMTEHFKAEIAAHPDNPLNEMSQQFVDAATAWINAQRRDFFVEVNLGNWAQLDYRTMAQESGNESLYKFAYRPFTQAAHNMWPHVSVHNARRCENPLHRHHLIPELIDARYDPDFMFRSCKYVHRTYESLVDAFSIELTRPLPLEWWEEYFKDEEGDSSETPSGETA